MEAFRDAGLEVDMPKAAMYLWLPLPPGLSSGTFANDLLERESVVVLPGAALGEGGEGYFRIALTVEPERMREAARRTVRVLTRLGAIGAQT